MKSLKSLLKKTPIIKKSNLRYLHYYPTAGKEFEPIQEPQKLGPYYKYIYNDEILPETFQYADKQMEKDPYIEANFYDWDNMEETKFMEYFEMTPNSLKILTLLFMFSLFYSQYYYLKKAKKEGKLDSMTMPYLRISEPWAIRIERY